jgi:Flp pilus assembly pilin Flp
MRSDRKNRELGAASLEYALLASLIAMVIVIAVSSLSDRVIALYATVVSAFS